MYQRAAEAGLPTAQADLADMLLKGEAGPPGPKPGVAPAGGSRRRQSPRRPVSSWRNCMKPAQALVPKDLDSGAPALCRRRQPWHEGGARPAEAVGPPASSSGNRRPSPVRPGLRPCRLRTRHALASWPGPSHSPDIMEPVRRIPRKTVCTIPMKSWAWPRPPAKPKSRRPSATWPRSIIPTPIRATRRRKKRSRKSPAAYDIVGDKDKRAKFDAGEIDADGNPRGFDPARLTPGRSAFAAIRFGGLAAAVATAEFHFSWDDQGGGSGRAFPPRTFSPNAGRSAARWRAPAARRQGRGFLRRP